jgi:hypothetical protein
MILKLYLEVINKLTEENNRCLIIIVSHPGPDSQISIIPIANIQLKSEK